MARGGWSILADSHNRIDDLRRLASDCQVDGPRSPPPLSSPARRSTRSPQLHPPPISNSPSTHPYTYTSRHHVAVLQVISCETYPSSSFPQCIFRIHPFTRSSPWFVSPSTQSIPHPSSEPSRLATSELSSTLPQVRRPKLRPPRPVLRFRSSLSAMVITGLLVKTVRTNPELWLSKAPTLSHS